jgi:hypothetical protein
LAVARGAAGFIGPRERRVASGPGQMA